MAQETIQAAYVTSDPATLQPAHSLPPQPARVVLTNMSPIVWGVVLGNLISGIIGSVLYYLVTH